MGNSDGPRIGWAEADITPEGGAELAGQYYQRVARGVHSRPGLTVMAVEAAPAAEQAVMVSMDLVGIPAGFLAATREVVAAEVPGIRPDRIIIGATHVHSAPRLSRGRNWWPPAPGTIPPERYREFVIGRLVAAIGRAWGERRPGSFFPGRGHAVLGHCRRALYAGGTAEMYGCTSRDDFTGLEGGEDSTVEILFTGDGAGRPTGAIVNVACPSQVMEATAEVSSDFMGEARRLLKEHFGGKFMTLCQVSAAGDQSPRDLTRQENADFWNAKGVSILGRRLAEAVIEAYRDKDTPAGPVEIRHHVAGLELPKRFPDAGEMRTAENERRRLAAIMGEEEAFADFCAEVKRNEKFAGRPGPYDSKQHHFVLIKNAEAVISRAAEKESAPLLEMEMHALRIGESVFCTNAFELFLDYGTRIRARSRARRTFVVQLCCGTAGYLPTERAEKHGGYGALINNSRVGAAGGEALVAKTLEAIEGLFC